MAVSERLYKQDRDGSIPGHSILEWTADWNGLESALISVWDTTCYIVYMHLGLHNVLYIYIYIVLSALASL